MITAPLINAYRPYWAKRFGTARFLPTTRAEMEALGWDRCDIVVVTGTVKTGVNLGAGYSYPVLVENAPLPEIGQLPSELGMLLRFEGTAVTNPQRFASTLRSHACDSRGP